MTGAPRTFNAGWLVECDVHVRAEMPNFVTYTEAEMIGCENGALIVNHHAINTHLALPDQLPTIAARAKTLRLQDAIKAELCHPVAAPIP